MSDLLKQRQYAAPATNYLPPRRSSPALDRSVDLPVADETAVPRADLSLAHLSGVLETIDQGILLMRSDAHPCFSNSAAERLLMTDAERGVLAREIRTVSRVVLDKGDRRPTVVEVATQAGWYRVRATLLLDKIKEISSRAVLVTIERAETSLPSRETLMRRFGMTGREADVTLLLAHGARNASIALELRISPHTARHHTESVLAKLHVHARGEVARAIVAGLAPEHTAEQ